MYLQATLMSTVCTIYLQYDLPTGDTSDVTTQPSPAHEPAARSTPPPTTLGSSAKRGSGAVRQQAFASLFGDDPLSQGSSGLFAESGGASGRRGQSKSLFDDDDE